MEFTTILFPFETRPAFQSKLPYSANAVVCYYTLHMGSIVDIFL